MSFFPNPLVGSVGIAFRACALAWSHEDNTCSNLTMNQFDDGSLWYFDRCFHPSSILT